MVSRGSSGLFARIGMFLLTTLLTVGTAVAGFVPGGTLDPTIVPKYVQPLVIPPVMSPAINPGTPAADYNIAVRQFKQQILPGGAWDVLTGRSDGFPATTVWSYGNADETVPTNFVAPVPLDPVNPLPAVGSLLPGQGITFNYPAFTVENISGSPTDVRWINDLKDPVTGNFFPHLLAVDQTLHWANPGRYACADGTERTDCETHNPLPYTGPVPMVVHVHGAHVDPHSDGYPEAWWLPAASNLTGTGPYGNDYSLTGVVYTQSNYANTVPGSAFYSYRNDQPATTIWYHDHTIGMTRLNVYAGPAGFWLIRGGANDVPATPPANLVLPGPAPTLYDAQLNNDPNFNTTYRSTIREIPIAIQDRGFNADGSLFYPNDRIQFDGFAGPYIGNSQDTLMDYINGVGPVDGSGRPLGNSDISGIWNPEAFFNTMVVNGTTWPVMEVAPARYRLRLLNGCNSRTLNLSIVEVTGNGGDGVFGNGSYDPVTDVGTILDTFGAELPIYQIGGDQGFLPQVVKITTGFSTVIPAGGPAPLVDTPASAADKALLLMNAERADVILDFTGMAGKRFRMLNTAPDAPFGGFPDTPADPVTSGQVMEFVVTGTALPSDANTTPPELLDLSTVAEAPLGVEDSVRPLSLNELVSDQVCVNIDQVTGDITTLFSRPVGDPTFANDCLNNTAPLNAGDTVEEAGPRMAKVGLMLNNGDGSFTPVPKGWADPVTEMPLLNTIELWELNNITVDAHPIHVHLVDFQVVNRQDLDPVTLAPVPGTVTGPEPNEMGYKDTVTAYPGQVTRFKAKFDIGGLYVWHCHIVEHEDNEMMRPFTVIDPTNNFKVSAYAAAGGTITAVTSVQTVAAVGGAGWASGFFPAGSRVDVTVTPDPGFQVDRVYLNSVLQGASTSFIFPDLQSEKQFKATFVPIPDYKVSAYAATGGSISAAGLIAAGGTGWNSAFYQARTDVLVAITPDAGYEIKEVYLDNVVQGPVTSLNLLHLTASHQVKATFALLPAAPSYKVSAYAGSNGQITDGATLTALGGAGWVSSYFLGGTDVVLNVIPDAGFQTATIYIDGVLQPVAPTVTLPGISTGHQVKATFAPL